MKKILFAILLFVAACNTNNNVDIKTTDNKTPITVALPSHTDDGSTYFNMQLLKNDSIQMHIENKRAFVMFGDENFIIQLDSSEHMLVNGTALNIYINSKGDKPQRYQVVEMSAGRDSATMMLGFKQEQTDIPGFIPTNGFIEVANIKNKKYSGNFEATKNDENGDRYILKGSFQNVGTAE